MRGAAYMDLTCFSGLLTHQLLNSINQLLNEPFARQYFENSTGNLIAQINVQTVLVVHLVVNRFTDNVGHEVQGKLTVLIDEN